ncbi:PRC-barrel domain-containing protein [Microvirga massiliensis]|uniref:PRC-barrel domain-containing protein n=1 Tax=Microvirga massiliensis TaxID=1033741 RepID=UPI00062BC30F|nr:PRC-barrel domain-containing protein [Microvirga massiliensis]
MAQATSTSAKPLIESDRVEGTTVYDASGERIGTVKRLMIEKVSGRVAYAVIAFGGVWKPGADDHTIPWGKLAYDTQLGGYRTDITESELKQAPSFAPHEHDWSDRDREEQLHDYYRIPPYWRAI